MPFHNENIVIYLFNRKYIHYADVTIEYLVGHVDIFFRFCSVGVVT